MLDIMQIFQIFLAISIGKLLLSSLNHYSDTTHKGLSNRQSSRTNLEQHSDKCPGGASGTALAETSISQFDKLHSHSETPQNLADLMIAINRIRLDCNTLTRCIPSSGYK